ncbi:MAG: hypothetical protein KKB51_09790 [Candidatus Riflebacteria bacterium]|nr:hypothetical protein [Candidatus Riflebacteria bacterium]
MNEIPQIHSHIRTPLVIVSQAGVFLAVLLAVQMLGLPNPVTGTLVNALLIFIMLNLGARYAVMLAILSPVGGIISGHLPAPLYPLLPVIMSGNVLLLAIYALLRNLPALVRYVVPAAIKGIMIWGAGVMIIDSLKLSDKVQWLILPVLGIQFFTAAAGLLLGEKLFAAFSRKVSRPPER